MGFPLPDCINYDVYVLIMMTTCNELWSLDTSYFKTDLKVAFDLHALGWLCLLKESNVKMIIWFQYFCWTEKNLSYKIRGIWLPSGEKNLIPLT